MSNFGYIGKIARIELSSGIIRVEEPDDAFYRKYLGGRALALHYLLKEMEFDVEPFDEKNYLLFATGVTTGARFPGNSRFTVASKSPLTGGFGESEAGGFWGAELKRAGYDALIITGKAKGPSYILIDDQNIKIKDASHLWGKDTAETEEQIYHELGGRKTQIVCIGQGGEHLVRYASIHNKSAHVAGRMGMGAVMGSKNLKAIAIHISKSKLKIFNEDMIAKKAKYFVQNFKANGPNSFLHDHGTAGAVVVLNDAGILPTRNFSSGNFEGASEINGDKIHAIMETQKEGCYACSVGCTKRVSYKGEVTIEGKYGGPEYESVAALGSNCGISNVIHVMKGIERCNAYGLDTISTGNVIAFAMECFEKGLIDRKTTDGINLQFGNGEALLEMLDNIAFRRGFGKVLSEGVKRAAQEIGGEALQYAVQCKGAETAMHEPRGKVGVGIGYAVGKGGDHIEMEHDECFSSDDAPFLVDMKPLGMNRSVSTQSLSHEKVAQFKELQQLWALYSCLDMCIFVGPPGRTFKVKDLLDLVEAATGWETSWLELMKTSERSINMLRVFNLLCGKTKEDDVLPPRFYERLGGEGVYSGSNIDKKNFEKAVNSYYRSMGWDENGVPRQEKLAELDLYWLDDKISALS